MIKVSHFGHLKHFYAFSQTFSSYQNQKATDLTVSKIISNQKRDPNFLYQNTKQVCQTISTLFQGIPKNQSLNIQELTSLMKSIHLSGFSSWKALRQTSLTIENVLNKIISQKKYKIQPLNLSSLLNILSSMNYELGKYSDDSFLNSQIFQQINLNSIQFNISGLRTINAISKHQVVFTKLILEKINFQEQMIKLLEECVMNQDDRSKNYLIANIIKNGIYQNQWKSEILESVGKILSKNQSLEMSLKGLFDAIQLMNVGIKSIQKDKWSFFGPHKQDSNILTQIRIVNILKQMDYDVRANQSLFNYEVDSKIGDHFIVEYHGIHHYRINHQRPIETKKSHWKVQAFKNRGYKVFVIPFYKWNKLQTAYQKKAYLIQSLQNQFLNQSI